MRRILTQREQWPDRVATPGLPAIPSLTNLAPKLPGQPKAPTNPSTPAAGTSPIGTTMPKTPDTSGMPSAPSVSRGPTRPLPDQVPKGDFSQLPSVEAAGITDVDYSHLPMGEPLTKAGPSSGGGTGPAGGGGTQGLPTTPGGGVGGAGAPVNYTPSGGVDQWTPQIEEGLRRNGLPTTPDYINKVKKQMQSESSGDPNAINKTDSNAIAGHPSQGLMQTIPGTFQQYHLPGDSNSITDPQANIDSAIGYGKSRYGPSLMDESGHGIGSGHGY